MLRKLYKGTRLINQYNGQATDLTERRNFARFPAGASEYLCAQTIHTGSEAHSASRSIIFQLYFPGTKQQVLETGHIVASSDDVNNSGSSYLRFSLSLQNVVYSTTGRCYQIIRHQCHTSCSYCFSLQVTGRHKTVRVV